MSGIIFQELVSDLTAAASLFRHYEKLHRAKGTADSDAKAEVNAAMAARLEASVAKATAGGENNDFPLGKACDLTGEGGCEACQ